MASEATCPFCGAERCGEFEWSCGTELRFGEKHGQSENCELRQQNADLRRQLSVSDEFAESRVAFVPTVKIADVTHQLTALRSQLATVTAEARRYITADDAIGEVCLQAGFDYESTLEAVQAMAARLVEVTAERDELLRRRLAEAPVYRMFTSDAGDVFIWADETWRGGTRVRLVRDDQPQQETVT